jgi:hypothetical protein
MMNGVAGMAVTISAKDTRSIRAIEIAAGTATWLHIREVGNGRVIGYQIPSQSKADGYYVVTQTFCTCFDAKRNPGQACKHQLAVRLHVELEKASQPKKPSAKPAAAPAPTGRPVLTMVRHADDGFTWERGADVEQAARYDAIFGEVAF